MTNDFSLTYLYRRLGLVEARVRAAVNRRRATDPDPDDNFRGLYITDAHVDQLLQAPHTLDEPEAPDTDSALQRTQVEEEADKAEAGGADVRVRRMRRAFGLDEYDVELFLIALAPDVDPRFERLYGYLHDDVSRRRASPGLALELCRGTFATGGDRSRLMPESPLIKGGLITLEDRDRPFLTRSLRVPDRVMAFVLGSDAMDPTIVSLLMPFVESDLEGLDRLSHALDSGSQLVYLHERPGGAGTSLGATVFRRAGRSPIVIDLQRIDASDSLKEISLATIREARLQDGGIVAGPVEALAEKGASAIRLFAEAPCPVILYGARSWDPGWARTVPFILEAPAPSSKQREAIWLSALNGHLRGEVDPALSTKQFRLTPEQIMRAAHAALLNAEAAGRPAGVRDLYAGARAQNAAGLEKLAHRREPKAGWGDLV
ncbi:MAG: ATP-binding protein, partial [Acidimicrobiia bacterium]